MVLSEGFLKQLHAKNCQSVEYCPVVIKLQAENKELYKALQSLCDVQNGPPLVRHKDSWQDAMDEAVRLLGKS